MSPITNTRVGIPLGVVTGKGCLGGTGRRWLVSMGGGERHPTPTVLSSPPLSAWPGGLLAQSTTHSPVLSSLGGDLGLA